MMPVDSNHRDNDSETEKISELEEWMIKEMLYINVDCAR